MTIFFLLFCQICIVVSITINLGGLFPVTGRLAAGGIARLSAARIAVEDVNKNASLLPSSTLELISKDTGTNERDTIRATLDLLDEHNVVALIGAASSTNSQAAQLIATAFERPQISYASTSAALNDTQRYPYFLRTPPSDALQAVAISDLIQHIGWRYVTVVYVDEVYGQTLSNALQEAFAGRVTVVDKVSISPASSVTEIQLVMESSFTRGRNHIMVLFAVGEDAVNILKAAHALGYSDETHVWLCSDGVMQTSVVNSIPPMTLIGTGAADLSQGAELQRFLDQWEVLDPEKYPGAGSRSINAYAPYAYDAVLVVAETLHRVLEEGGNIYDGRNLYNVMQSVRMHGITGEISFYGNDRVGSSYQILNEVDGKVLYAGFWSEQSGLRLEAPLQFFEDSSVPPSDEVVCPYGRFALSDLDTVFCGSCARNEFYDKSLVPPQCKNCPYGLVVDIDGQQCVECADGTQFLADNTSSGGSCVPIDRSAFFAILLSAVIALLLFSICTYFVARRVKKLRARRVAAYQRTLVLEEKADVLFQSNRRLSDLNALLQAEVQERKRVTKLLKRAKVRAEAANEAKSQLLANMSHELRTPLTTISLATDLLDETPLSVVQREYTETVAHSTKMLLALVNDILDISRIENGKLLLHAVPSRLSTLVEEPVRLLYRPAVNKNIDLACVVSVDPSLLAVCDEVRVKQIVLNLTNNAIKFTREGYVLVSLAIDGDDKADNDDGRGEKRDASDAGLVRDRKRALTVVIKVRDTGSGISRENARRLFDRFEQVDASDTRSQGGVGLGLAICSQLCRLMNGSITLRSEVNVGSEFEVRLPMQRFDAPVETSDAERGDESHLNVRHNSLRGVSGSSEARPGSFDHAHAYSMTLEERAAISDARDFRFPNARILLVTHSEVTAHVVRTYLGELVAVGALGYFDVGVLSSRRTAMQWVRVRVTKRTALSTLVLIDDELVLTYNEACDYCEAPSTTASLVSDSSTTEPFKVGERSDDADNLPGACVQLCDAICQKPLNDVHLQVISKVPNICVLEAPPIVTAATLAAEPPPRGRKSVRTTVLCKPISKVTMLAQIHSQLRAMERRQAIAAERATAPGGADADSSGLNESKVSSYVFVSPLTGLEISLRILLAEDNLMNQRLVERVLVKAGHMVKCASDGEEVMRAYEETPFSFDLILMDCQMPKLSGWTCTRKIRAMEASAVARRHIPIIALTAGAMRGDREECVKAGMDAYVAKPVQNNKLFGTMYRLMSGVISKESEQVPDWRRLTEDGATSANASLLQPAAAQRTKIAVTRMRDLTLPPLFTVDASVPAPSSTSSKRLCRRSSEPPRTNSPLGHEVAFGNEIAVGAKRSRARRVKKNKNN